jgi:uncharacterized protein (TIGR03382 family)
MLLAQALVEHGLLDSMAAGIVTARDRLEIYIGRGNSTYLLIALGVVLLVLLVRRRR